jgi:hypothetical protein
MTNDVDTAPPATVRRLDSADAAALAELAAMFEDLQTVLRCCDRLVSELGAENARPDDLVLDAFWTTAVLAYARCFAPRASGTTLTPEDVTSIGLNGDVLGWHRVLLQLRDQYADPGSTPRSAFSVGVAQDSAGKASGIAVTSAPHPRVDEVTVRQTGAVTYGLSRIVDGRIAERQEAVFAATGPMTKAELDRLPLVEVTVDDDHAGDPA